MKKLLLLLTFIFPFTSIAQEKMKVDSITNKIYISATREVQLPKEEIQKKVKYWIAAHYKSAKDVITYDSPELITLMYVSNYRLMGNYVCQFYNILTVQIKDNKYKATITNIENADPQASYPIEHYILKPDGSFKNTKYYQSLIIDVREGTKSTLQSLHRHINNETAETDF